MEELANNLEPTVIVTKYLYSIVLTILAIIIGTAIYVLFIKK